MEERAKNAKDVFSTTTWENHLNLALENVTLKDHRLLNLDSAIGPQSIALDPVLERIYVTDTVTGQVSMFEKLEPKGQWPPKQRFESPRSIMTLPDNRIGMYFVSNKFKVEFIKVKFCDLI